MSKNGIYQKCVDFMGIHRAMTPLLENSHFSLRKQGINESKNSCFVSNFLKSPKVTSKLIFLRFRFAREKEGIK